MRMSSLFSRTLRKTGTPPESVSHDLLQRAGFIRQLASGIYSYLPLAQRSIRKIEAILREEMNGIGGQEITMPLVNPADIWKETGRWFSIGSEMTRLTDRNERDMVLAMTHEEVVADLVRKEIQSYRQLPCLIYQLQTKWRDDPRPRAGLIRVREFTMKDSYSLDRDWEGLDRQYDAHYHAYLRIFRRCGLPAVAVKSDTGMMGGKEAHEFMYLSPIGEDTLIICPSCGYTANRQVAVFRKAASSIDSSAGTLHEKRKISTPGIKTIDDLALFLGIPKEKTAKAFMQIATLSGTSESGPEAVERQILVFAVIRGDLEVNETKLQNAVNASALRPATEEEIRATGTVPGYASPVGIKRKDVLVVADDSIPGSTNLVAGANETDYHLNNVNYGRDFSADIVADISAAKEGDPCIVCGSSLTAKRGVEVGNIFKLGTRYSEAMGCSYLDADGKPKPVIMGSYGIGVGRLLACIAEEHNDDRGLVWPVTVAPYHVYLVRIGNDETVTAAADTLYAGLVSRGVEVLYDDRDERAGVKFNDADLIGLPLRVTVSAKRIAEGEIELRGRTESESKNILLESAVDTLVEIIGDLRNGLEARPDPV